MLYQYFILTKQKGTSVDAISELYAALAAVCYYTLLRPNQENQDYFLRVMVLCIVLYDHTNPSGAFSKTASINVKASVKVIRESGSSLAENLVNILKYSTLHLNDEATPKATKALFL